MQRKNTGVVTMILIIILPIVLILISFIINTSIHYVTKIRLQSTGDIASSAIKTKFYKLLINRASEKPEFNLSDFQSDEEILYDYINTDDLLYIKQEQSANVDSQVKEITESNLLDSNIKSPINISIKYLWPTADGINIDCNINKYLIWNIKLSKYNTTILGKYIDLRDFILTKIEAKDKLRICK